MTIIVQYTRLPFKLFIYFTFILLWFPKLVSGVTTIANCSKISGSLCLYCGGDYALDSSRTECLQTSITHCIYLDTLGRCLECACGCVANSSGSKCVVLTTPIEGCRQIDAYNQCSRAKTFFMLLPNYHVVVNGGSHCAMKSNAWSTADCFRCHEGYYLNFGKCYALTNPAMIANSYAGIVYYNSTTSQIEFICDDTYLTLSSLDQISNAQNIGCYPTISYCQEYTFETDTSMICNLCDSDHIVANNGKNCQQITSISSYTSSTILANCIEINSTYNACVRCNSDDLKILNGSCVARTTFITNCLTHSSSANTCQECIAGYYLQSSTLCTARTVINCGIYSVTLNRCVTCATPKTYYFNSASGTCIARTQLSVNCLNYSVDTDECILCSSSYYVSSGTCAIRTATNCQKGTVNADTCDLCYYDYLLLPNKTCQISAIANKKCLSVSASGVCNTCMEQYGARQSGIDCLDNFLNIPFCAVYTVGQVSSCDKCVDGFVLTVDQGKCMIPYGSCIDKYSPCVGGYITTGSTYEKYICKTSLKAVGVSVSSGYHGRLRLDSLGYVCLMILSMQLLVVFA